MHENNKRGALLFVTEIRKIFVLEAIYTWYLSSSLSK